MSDHGLDLDRIKAKLGGHSIFAPSASAMWLNCSGSLIPNLLAEDTAGVEAAEGTVAHGVGEEWLVSGMRPKHLIGTVQRVEENTGSFDIEIDAVMLEQVERYVTWCWQLDGDHFVETRVNFDDLTPIPEQGGTADHAACLPGLLVITDLKYGKGEQVFAKNNTQALLYAYGFFRQYDWFYNFKKILIRICQPRLDHFDEWEITRDDLLMFAGWARARAALAWMPDALRSPGAKQCLWCKVKGNCAARLLLEEKMVDEAFEDLVEVSNAEINDLKARLDDELGDWSLERPPVAELSIEHLSKILKYRKTSERWWAEVHDTLEKRLKSGRDVPGQKLVAGRSFREFINEKKAVEHLDFLGLPRSAIFETKMLSPARLEDELMRIGYARRSLPDLLASIVRKPEGNPTMVPEDDPRPSLDSRIDEVFDYSDDL